MDCAACGKPLSVTAKFCGKCGAPVKRSTKAPEPEAHNLAHPELAFAQEEVPASDAPSMAVEASAPPDAVQTTEAPTSAPVDDLVIHLAPQPSLREDHALPNIDLNLEPLPSPAGREALSEAAQTDTAWLHRLEQHQQELKKTLEKHSLLLDFISLTSQQQSHQQTQPDPLEPLVSQVAEQQTSLQSQLTQLAALLSQNEAQQHSQRMPEEFKLQLEKQKIEIHKLMAQSLAQNNENLKDDQHEVIEHLEKRIEAYHQAAQQSLEKNMGALASGMSELKTQLQAVQKKAAEKSVSKSASSGADSDGGSFMIFVIGLLCGLTVVLSSLAIYNFLSHEPPKADKHDGADTHEAAPADKHDAPPAEKPH
jgi:hypothetical protein